MTEEDIEDDGETIFREFCCFILAWRRIASRPIANIDIKVVESDGYCVRELELVC